VRRGSIDGRRPGVRESSIGMDSHGSEPVGLPPDSCCGTCESQDSEGPGGGSTLASIRSGFGMRCLWRRTARSRAPSAANSECALEEDVSGGQLCGPPRQVAPALPPPACLRCCAHRHSHRARGRGSKRAVTPCCPFCGAQPGVRGACAVAPDDGCRHQSNSKRRSKRVWAVYWSKRAGREQGGRASQRVEFQNSEDVGPIRKYPLSGDPFLTGPNLHFPQGGGDTLVWHCAEMMDLLSNTPPSFANLDPGHSTRPSLSKHN
jgi:hypothetical protein